MGWLWSLVFCLFSLTWRFHSCAQKLWPTWSEALLCSLENRFILSQIDDDTMVNPFTLVDYLKVHDNETKSSFVCKITKNVGPIRNRTSKFFVSYSDYPDDGYPEYCQGKTNPAQGQQLCQGLFAAPIYCRVWLYNATKTSPGAAEARPGSKDHCYGGRFLHR